MRHIKWTHPPNPLRANAHTRARARLGEGAKHPLRWWCNYVGLIPLSQYQLSGLLPYAASAVSAHDASNQPWFYAFPFSRLSAPCAHGPTWTAVTSTTWSVFFWERIHSSRYFGTTGMPKVCSQCGESRGRTKFTDGQWKKAEGMCRPCTTEPLAEVMAAIALDGKDGRRV